MHNSFQSMLFKMMRLRTILGQIGFSKSVFFAELAKET